MENVIDFNLLNVGMRRFVEHLNKLLRVIMVAVFFLCLYINCVYGAEELGLFEESMCKTQMIENIPPLKNQDNAAFAYFVKGPEVLLPGAGLGFVKRADERVLSDTPNLENTRQENISPDVIEKSKENVETGETTGDKDADDSVPIFPTVILNGNGGFPEIVEMKLDTLELNVENLDKPKRLGKEFDKWFTDVNCTIPFTAIAEGAKTVNLYAGWKEFAGFLSNDEGYITGYTDIEAVTRSRVLKLPRHESCLGLAPGAVSGLEDYVEDVYIPENIVYLPEGIFDNLYGLMFIQVAADNPVFKSKNGVLYTKDGQLVCIPPGQAAWN